MPASPAVAVLPGLLDAPGPAFGDHLTTHGPLPVADAAVLAGSAGRTGGGGALARAAVGIRAVAREVSRARRAPVVVADGAERDPAGLGHRALLARAPHLVLDGLALTGRTLGATTLVLAADPGGLPAVARALAERGDGVWLHPAVASGAGEEQHAGLHGTAGRPTLVVDAETLARLALLARGCTEAAARTLVTRHWEAAGVPRADVTDAGPGARLADLLPLGGAQAVLVGGSYGTWLPAGAARALTLGEVDPAVAGVGVIAALPADRCGLVETARVVGHLARDCAGRCGRAPDALSRAAAAVGVLAAPSAAPRGVLDDVVRWSRPGAGRGRCRHADGAARLVAGALETFAGELTAHRYGSCTATAWAPFLPVPPAAR